MNISPPPVTPEAQNESYAVGEFLGRILHTGQESAEKGNETPAAFFEQTADFLEEELRQIDLQLLREDDADERIELEKSKSELERLDRDVRSLAKTLVAVSATQGNIKPAVKQILAHGLSLFGEIKGAVDKSKQRVRQAIATDDGPVSAQLEARRRLLQQRMQETAVFGGRADALMVGIAMLMNFVSDAREAAGTEIEKAAEIFSATADEALEDAPLSMEDKQFLSSQLARRNAERFLNEFREALQAYRSGRKTPAQIYEQFVHLQAVQLMSAAPDGLRQNGDFLTAKLALEATDRALAERFGQSVAPEQMSALGPELQAGAERTEEMRAAGAEYKRQLEFTGHLLIVAQNDIERALMGEPLNTGALSQLMSAGDVEKIREAVDERAKETPRWPTEAMIEGVKTRYNDLLQALTPSQGFDIGGFNSFAARLKGTN